MKHNNLIIYAHPPGKGHCATILEELKRRFDEHHAVYEVLDLYAMEYDPILREKELYGEQRPELTSQTMELQQKIRDADRLIFIYPVWWNSTPAILKGFFDRVFTSGFAFRYRHILPAKVRGNEFMRWLMLARFDFGIPIGLLSDKKAIVFATTGSPKIAFFFTGHRFKTNIKRDLLGFYGIKTRIYHIDNCRKVDHMQTDKIRRAVAKVKV